MTRGEADGEDLLSVRLDVWLDVACLFPTRSKAKEACLGGKVDVNGCRAKPHRQMRVGDRLAVTLPGERRREVVVRGLAARPIPKIEARALYEDVTPAPSTEVLETRLLDRMMQIDPSGRPSARDRRELRRWKGRE